MADALEHVMTPTDPTMTHVPSEPGDASEAAWDAGMAAAFGPGDGGENRPAGPGAGTVLAGKFTLSELIDEGGMGSVWVAHQTEPVKRKVAVKLIKAGMDSATVLARFAFADTAADRLTGGAAFDLYFHGIDDATDAAGPDVKYRV